MLTPSTFHISDTVHRIKPCLPSLEDPSRLVTFIASPDHSRLNPKTPQFVSNQESSPVNVLLSTNPSHYVPTATCQDMCELRPTDSSLSSHKSSSLSSVTDQDKDVTIPKSDFDPGGLEALVPDLDEGMNVEIPPETSTWRIWLENAYSLPKIGVYGLSDPIYGLQYQRNPKGTL